MRFLVF